MCSKELLELNRTAIKEGVSTDKQYIILHDEAHMEYVSPDKRVKELLVHIVDSYKKQIEKVGLTVYAQYLNKVYQEYNNTHDQSTYKYLLALCVKGVHQRRMPWRYVVKAIEILENTKVFKHYNSFEDIYNTISNLFEKGDDGNSVCFVKGKLTKYDVALHIGQIIRIYPKDFVYLAEHTMKSARCLFREKIPYKSKISIFSSLFENIESMYIEDILCVFDTIFDKYFHGKTITNNDVEEVLNSKIKECYVCLKKEYVLMKIEEYSNGTI